MRTRLFVLLLTSDEQCCNTAGTKEPGFLRILIKLRVQPNNDEVYPNFNCVFVPLAPLVLLCMKGN